MKQDFSYRFKPEMKRLDFQSIINIALIGVVAFFAFKVFKGFGILPTSTQATEGDSVQKAINNSQLPTGLDIMKLEDRLNRLENKLYSINFVDSSGIYSLLEDLNSKELDWIYLKWGTREFLAVLFGIDKKNLNLFGWFDEQVNNRYITKLKVLFDKSTFKYKPA